MDDLHLFLSLSLRHVDPAGAARRRSLPTVAGRCRGREDGSGAGRRLATVNMLCATTTTTGNRLIPDGRAGGPGSLGGGVSELDTAQLPGVPRARVLAVYRSRSVIAAARSGARPALRVSSATDLNPGWVIAEFH